MPAVVQWQLAGPGVQSIQLQCLGASSYRGLPAPSAQGWLCGQPATSSFTKSLYFKLNCCCIPDSKLGDNYCLSSFCYGLDYDGVGCYSWSHTLSFGGLTKLHLLWHTVSINQQTRKLRNNHQEEVLGKYVCGMAVFRSGLSSGRSLWPWALRR